MSLFYSAGLGGTAIPDSVVHHYDSTELTGADGDPISTWPDKEGSADLTQATSTQQPTLRENEINGNQAVEFDGSDDRIDTSWSISTPFMIFGAGYLRTLPSKDAAMWSGRNIDEQILRYSDVWDVRNTAILETGVSPTTDIHVWGVMYDDGTSTEFREDGVSEKIGDAGNTVSGGLNLGSNSTGGNNAAPVTWAELMVCDTDPSQSDVDTIEPYLGDKYGVAIS